MNGFMVQRLGDRDHERARELAAARLDGFATADEIAWLEGHLGTCEPCRTFAEELGAQSALFAPGRAAMPEAPRDLWARTAAAIEAERRPARTAAGSRRRRFGGGAFVPLAGALVVVVAVGVGLLNGLPARESTSKGEEPDATPIALSAGNVTVLVRGEDGSLELRRQVVDEVCPLDADGCGVVPSPEVTRTDLLADDDSHSWTAFISPASDEVVVMDRDGTGIFVLPLGDTQPIVTAPPSTERPTLAATAEPTILPSDSPEPSPDASASAGVSPSESPASTDQATQAPSEEPTASAPTGSPEVTPEATPQETSETTPEPTPETTPEPTASVAITPRPDGAIEILSDVVLVGTSAAYSPDGSRFAFTARPADGSAGPNVYVWQVGEERALAVTEDHASQFSGWLGDELLVSRAVAGDARTVILSLADGAERPAHDGPMWLPTVGPRAKAGVWWDGSVAPAADGVAWVPEDGELVLEPWPAGAGDRQVLAEDVTDWQAAWDPNGRLLAVWTTTGDPGEAGSLSLYAVDPATGRADLDAPKLDAEPAFEGFSIGPGRLMWSAPEDAGDSTVQVLAWDGDTFGRLEILAEDGTKVVR